ncbi:hypothetical protein BU23DRAFT_129608 [Bimuria novae-zelandiae CBS 107.79]|uniref:Uncharacterized protein n=1 Tax=Bimuria novae-zelandiae CBS 107.79 TaxID=1447943 RepID=A0A6A5V969_9PLEO|nr:hypothetical protein BU23DRAFT_129608 [Bimuria novae-zelandiae CBS 107.79]
MKHNCITAEEQLVHLIPNLRRKIQKRPCSHLLRHTRCRRSILEPATRVCPLTMCSKHILCDAVHAARTTSRRRWILRPRGNGDGLVVDDFFDVDCVCVRGWCTGEAGDRLPKVYTWHRQRDSGIVEGVTYYLVDRCRWISAVEICRCPQSLECALWWLHKHGKRSPRRLNLPL